MSRCQAGGRKGCPNIDVEERKKIDRWLKSGLNASQIARELKRSPSAIQKEVIRGRCTQIVDPRTGRKAEVYCWDYAQLIADNAAAQKGRPRKIDPSSDGLDRVKELIKSQRRFSPYAALVQAKQEKRLPVSICTNTLYAYVRSGEYGLCGMDLHHPNAKRHGAGNEERREAKNRPAELSIDNRPKAVARRAEFGHWEGDLVCSPTKLGHSVSVLTLLERKTRMLIAMRVPSKSPKSIKGALDSIEQWLGELFPRVVKTITFDNGVEFVDYKLMTASIDQESAEPRFAIYYAHPYRSGERGSNENANGMLRRAFPKGTDFARVTSREIADAASWINNYPRKLLGGKSANALFDAEIRKIKRSQKTLANAA